MATLTAFRAAVQADLAATLGIEFVEGMIEGPLQERDLGCCWSLGKDEVPDHIQEETLVVRARVFLRYHRPESVEKPLRVEPLETLAEQLQAAVKDSQLAYGPWMARLVRLELVPERQYVEATITGWQLNAGV